MSRLACAASLSLSLWAGAPAPVQELRPALTELEDASSTGQAFVELHLERDTYLLHEPFVLRLRFGLETEFMRTSLVQLFQRELDVPVQLQAPWLDELEGAAPLGDLEPAAGASVALGERIVWAEPQADVAREGRTFRVFELARTFAATRTGALELTAPLVRFAYATRFEDDFVQGHRALDRRDAFVRGATASLAIQPLPEVGRPAEFTGAIGRFGIEATADPSRLVLGESFALTVRIVGESAACDLSNAAEPRLDGLDGFHVRGSLAERTPRTLTVRYDVEPLAAGVVEVPPIRFAFFDTAPPAGYVTIETRPVPLVVEAPAAEASAPEPRTGGRRRTVPIVAAITAVGLALLALALRAARRAGQSS